MMHCDAVVIPFGHGILSAMSGSDVFEDLQPLLVDAIPRSLSEATPSLRTCVVRVYYFDTHAPCTYLELRTVSESLREQLISTRGKAARYFLWSSAECCSDGPDPEVSLGLEPHASEDVVAGFAQIYSLLCQNEDTYMKRFRDMLHLVAFRLNQLDWSAFLNVTEDFVVVPADGSQFFANEFATDVYECRKSIPRKKRKLLKARHLFPGFFDEIVYGRV